MWDTFTEFLGQPWVAQAIALIAALGTLIGILVHRSHRKSEIAIMRNIERNTSKPDSENDKPPRPADDRERVSPASIHRASNSRAESETAGQSGPNVGPRRSERNIVPDTSKPGSENDKPPRPAADRERASPADTHGASYSRVEPETAGRSGPNVGPRRSDGFTQRQFDSELLKILVEQRDNGHEYHIVISRDLHRRVVGRTGHNRMPMACNAMWKQWKRQGGKRENIIRTTKSGRSSTIEIKYDLSILD